MAGHSMPGHPGTHRLGELLARNLGTSKTEIRRLMAAGAVADEAGGQLRNPRAPIDDAALPLRLRVDGEPLTLVAAAHLMLHKPAGCVTALTDTRHPTAFAFLHDAPLAGELRAVGRLDLDTTGLLLWTTDGHLLHRLTHPKRAVPRTYEAALVGPFRAPPVDFELDDGHRPRIVELTTIAAADARPGLERPDDATDFARITIVGGAYHEVRRIFAALGSEVVGLCRTRFGQLELPADLAPGSYRAFVPADVVGGGDDH